MKQKESFHHMDQLMRTEITNELILCQKRCQNILKSFEHRPNFSLKIVKGISIGIVEKAHDFLIRHRNLYLAHIF